nr:stalk domain-containing protein [uncultured Anaerotignum sp.]
MKCKKVVALSVVFSMLMANMAYAANPKIEITYRDSYEDGFEISYDDGTVKYADDAALLMMVNGDFVSNANAIIKNGSTLVPLRVVSERLQAAVAWEAKTKTITIKKGGDTIIMQIGNRTAKLNQRAFQMNQAPQIVGGYTYVPIRAVAESFNADVGYTAGIKEDLKIVWVQDKTRTVTVSRSEAVQKATDIYFKDFLPGMRGYVLENQGIDVNEITPSNIGTKTGLRYSGKCLADLGEYYYIQVLENGVGVLVDKYDGTCYAAGAFSLVFLRISEQPGHACWGFEWQ